MSRNLLIALVGVGLLLVSVPALAHHSEAAEFDDTKPVKVTGEVVKVEWQNPHVWYYVDGTDELSGRTAVWGFSAGAPNSMRRRGITSAALGGYRFPRAIYRSAALTGRYDRRTHDPEEWQGETRRYEHATRTDVAVATYPEEERGPAAMFRRDS